MALPPPSPTTPGGSGGADPIQQLIGAVPGAGNIFNGGGFNYSAASSPNDQVLVGFNGPGRTAASSASYQTISDLMKQAYGTWDSKQIGKMGAQFVAAGWLQPGDESNFDKVSQAYQRVLEMTALMNKAGRYVTPQDVMNQYLGTTSQPTRPSSYSETTKSFDFTNPKSARALLKQSLQDRIGRDPTAAEQQSFMAALHQAERENPTVRTTKYKLDPATQQYQTTDTATEGGLDPQAYLGDYAEGHNQKEFGAYQAATTYFNALMQAIGAPVG